MKGIKIIIGNSALTALLLLAFPRFLTAQTTYQLSPDKDAILNVLGSSNVHDWTMTSSEMESQGDFKFDEENQLRALSSFSFTVNAKSLKSRHESMDGRTYKAIKADLFPTILYKLHSAVITLVLKDKYLVRATGDLTIAGTTHAIMLNVNVVVNPDHSITCSGFEKLKLTDYKIDVPRFMLGTMKVNNDLTIQFNFNCKKKSTPFVAR